MKKIKFIICSLLFVTLAKSQDSTKVIKHEIGFNTVLLVKQLISNNPTATLDQLPYSVFYNMYFNNTIGIRVGLGLSNAKYKTTIEGQVEPRETKQQDLNVRGGITYNFIKHQKLTLNAFVDGIYNNSSYKTVNTQTINSFPQTINVTTTSSDKMVGTGGQIGVGVKYDLLKYLSLYIEVPISFVASTVTSEVETTRSNATSQKNSNKDVITRTYITLPSTLYLVLRF
jgi:hypothetical protein